MIHEIIRTADEQGKNVYHDLDRDKDDVPARTKVYTFLSTPGHGYLRVPNTTLRDLNITRDISSCSYVGRTETSLEEDSDFRVFLDAVLDSGQRFFFKVKYVEHANTGMRLYHPDLVEKTYGLGDTFTDVHGQPCKIIEVGRRATEIENINNGMTYRVRTRQLLHFVQPQTPQAYILVHPEYGALQGTSGESEFHWTGTGGPKPPTVLAFTSRAAVDRYVKQDLPHAVMGEVCQIVEINFDCWTHGDRAPIDAVVRAGVPAWEIDPKFDDDKDEPVTVRYERGGYTIIHNKEGDGTPLYHTFIQPGQYFIVSPIMVDKIPHTLYSKTLSDGLDYYLPRRCLRPYISAVQAEGYAFYGRRVWHPNPLWEDALQPIDMLKAVS